MNSRRVRLAMDLPTTCSHETTTLASSNFGLRCCVLSSSWMAWLMWTASDFVGLPIRPKVGDWWTMYRGVEVFGLRAFLCLLIRNGAPLNAHGLMSYAGFFQGF